MSKNAKFITEAKHRIEKVSNRLRDGQPLQVSLYSDKNSVDIDYFNVHDNQPFHIASIGKMFTATSIGMLHDKGLLNIDDAISKYLTNDVLERLFVYKAVDYQAKVTIRHLLGHTSGIADYFESKVNAESPFLEQIMNEPDKKWTPELLLNFTRDKQSPIGPPGTFGYSDTGYILLGLIIEKVAQKSFDATLEEYIFRPLEMKDSYLMFYGKPANPYREIAPIYLNGKEVSKFNMLSCDWAGGGIISTTRDLLKFQKAYWEKRLVSESYMHQMATINHKFRSGMHYGLGMMEIRFNEFFFLLRGLPRPKGHSGILATHMYYDEEHDLHVIMNLGSNKMMVKSFRTFIAIEQSAKKYLDS